MPDISIKQLAKEIFVRNKQSELTRLNLQRTGVSAVPQVAVFFIEETAEGFKLHGKSCNLQDGRLQDGIKSYPDNHCLIWRDVQDENLAWAKKKYLDVPRGSVLFDANNIVKPMFIVTLPLKYRDNQQLIDLVLSTYHIPAERAVYRFEELY